VPHEILVTAPDVLPPTLSVLDRADLSGQTDAYKPWITIIPQSGELIMSYASDHKTLLVIRRSSDAGAPGSWGPEEPHPEVDSVGGCEECAVHALHDGTVVLVDGTNSAFWSADGARSFHNVSGVTAEQPTPQTPFHFGSRVEGASWSLLELLEEEHGMPPGTYLFSAETIWRSVDSARSWTKYTEAHSVGTTAAITDYPYGADSDAGFFMQSEVYRRKDGTFLHGCRVPTHSNKCDNWDGSQLWHSSDPNGSEWRCISQAAAGYCHNATWRKLSHDTEPCNWDAMGVQPKPHPVTYVDRCANLSSAPFLKPGSMYTHFLRLHDGRLLLTWTKRSPKYDDDGYGSGTRGLLSDDDGLTWDTARDYIVLQAQNDSWSSICRAGCGCHVGYGNTIQLPNGTLLTVYCHDPPPGSPTSVLGLVGLVRWGLPPRPATRLKTDGTEALKPGDQLDLASATYSFDTKISPRTRAAVSAILPSAWAAGGAAQAEQPPRVVLCVDPLLPWEGFHLRADALGAGGVIVELRARSDRGFILGAGRLRRELRIHSSGRGAVRLPLPFEVAVSQPSAAQHQQIRGVEFTTAFVGPVSTQPGGFGSWENAERYVKELAIFGGNEVELAHPEMGDVLNSMVGNWSRLCDRWDIDLSIWLPTDNTVTPFTPADAQQFSELFSNCTRLDAIHIPGGDGGPGYFSDAWWDALKEVASILRRHHPKAEVTVSANGFNSSSFERFFEALEDPETQTWLDGLQLGKEEPLPLAQFVTRLSQVRMSPPRKPYYILRVPDITHTVETGFPVPAWDYAWSSTHGREAINPAPLRFAAIIAMRNNGSTPTLGYSAYSEGLNGDYNKCLWSALTMEPNLSAENLTRQYARTFFGAENEEAATAGLIGLEQNWIGRAEANAAPAKTLRLWEQVQPNGSSWRFDMHRFRATVDAYVQARQRHELTAEAAARATLRAVGSAGVDGAIATARASLSNGSGFGEKTEQGRALKLETWRLFGALNDSAALCPGCASGGGVNTISSQAKGTLNLQNIDSPLSNAPWLLRQLARVSLLPSETAKRQAIESLLSPTWPIELPEGSFYDWVGSISSADRPHLLMGEGVQSDPMHYFTPLLGGSGCTGRHYVPGSAQTEACLASVPLKRMSKVGVSKGQKLQMRWESLDVHARYTLHVAFPGPLTHDAYGSETDHSMDDSIRLWAGSSLLMSGLPTNVTILTLPVPRNETARGALSFSCDTVGSPEADAMFQFLFGVDCKLSEVWLVRGDGARAAKVKRDDVSASHAAPSTARLMHGMMSAAPAGQRSKAASSHHDQALY
jgi:hypothetical protein